MKTGNLKILWYAMFLVTIFGCTKEYPDIPSDLIVEKDIVINNNLRSLNQKIIQKNQSVGLLPFTQRMLKSGGYATNPSLEEGFAFTLLAESLSPEFEGITMQATHVDIYNNYAFVSFNLKGPEFLGGVQVFDVSTPENPMVISEAILPYMDVSSLAYFENKLYLAGAYDPTVNNTTYKTPAAIAVLSMNQAMQISGTDSILDISSYVSTDISVANKNGEIKIFCTSGDDGEYQVYNGITFLREFSEEVTDARAIELYDEKAYILKNNPGEVIVFDGNAVAVQYALDANLTPESKSELDVNSHGIFAALNANGLQYQKFDGTTTQHIPKPKTPEGELEENHVTNSVSVNDKLILIGNGGSGVYVGYIGEQSNDSIVLLGKMNFSGSESVNFVHAEENLIFVASGLGGLKILTYELEETYELKTCRTNIGDIEGFLPENVNNRETHPEYFADTLDFNVILTKESNVYIEFLHEGAGYRNTFGYYTYPIGNPPGSAEQVTQNIIFREVDGSPGGTPKNVKYQIGNDPFPENTVIGFYVIINSIDNTGNFTGGDYTIYSNKQLNEGDVQQFILMYDEDCKDLILTYEDIHILNGPEGINDKDYNDGVFIISDNPTDTIVSTSFDLSKIPLATEL